MAGSNSQTSINKKLVTWASSHLEGNELEILDLNDFELPLYSPEIENTTGIPENAKKWAAKIDGADFLLISLAEHNGNYSAAFKNLMDWTSRMKGRLIFNGKPVFLMATSPGARGGASVLEIARNRFPFDGAVVEGGFSLPLFLENFEEGKGIIHEEKRKELMDQLEGIKKKYF